MFLLTSLEFYWKVPADCIATSSLDMGLIAMTIGDNLPLGVPQLSDVPMMSVIIMRGEPLQHPY